MFRRKFTRLISMVLALCLIHQAYLVITLAADDPFANWPKVLLKDVDDVARDYVDQAAAVLSDPLVQPIDTAFNRIFVYAIADAITQGDLRLRALDVYQYMGETARTDKQIGSTPSSTGSTSAIEKPGLISLIGLAIERGAIQQAVNGTSITLSTSPYALAALSEGDNATTYQKFGALRRVGVSATYTITDASQLLANVSRKQLDQFSIRLRLTPDRGTRSKEFLSRFDTEILPKIQRRLIVLTREEAKLFVDDRAGNRALNTLRNHVKDLLHEDIKRQLGTYANATDRANRGVADIKRIILERLQSEVYHKTASDLGLNDSDLKRIKDEFIPDLIASHEDLMIARKAFEQDINDLYNKWLVTFSYTNHPVQMGSAYSEFKLVGERGIAPPLKITFNAVGSIYHDPDPMKNQERFKGFFGAGSLEYSVTPGYLKDTPDLGKITYAVTGHYQRIQENRGLPMKAANIGIAQFKASFPISNGVTIPLSVTYATATDLIKEDHVRGNFGISFDLDKFAALAKLLKR